jgi:hypothetical protein
MLKLSRRFARRFLGLSAGAAFFTDFAAFDPFDATMIVVQSIGVKRRSAYFAFIAACM